MAPPLSVDGYVGLVTVLERAWSRTSDFLKKIPDV
jgi:hypothetical protein